MPTDMIPTFNDTLAPYTILLKTSLPNSSVPNINLELGEASLASSNISVTSYLAI